MRDDETRSRSFARTMRQSLTDAETILWSRLRRGGLAGARFRRQHPIGPWIADFACHDVRLVVEVDGATHSSPDELARDARRSTDLAGRGWSILRVHNADVYRNLNAALDTIFARLKALGFTPEHPLRPASPDTSPARRGRWRATPEGVLDGLWQALAARVLASARVCSKKLRDIMSWRQIYKHYICSQSSIECESPILYLFFQHSSEIWLSINSSAKQKDCNVFTPKIRRFSVCPPSSKNVTFVQTMPSAGASEKSVSRTAENLARRLLPGGSLAHQPFPSAPPFSAKPIMSLGAPSQYVSHNSCLASRPTTCHSGCGLSVTYLSLQPMIVYYLTIDTFLFVYCIAIVETFFLLRARRPTASTVEIIFVLSPDELHALGLRCCILAARDVAAASYQSRQQQYRSHF